MEKKTTKTEKAVQMYAEKTMKAFIIHTNIKIKHPDAIILVRIGDFYETFSRDAQDVSRICGTTLTTIPTGQEQTMFPHLDLDTYLPKLIRAGKRIAICDAM